MSSARTFKAVLWDFGGVILSSPFEAFNRYEVQKGLPKDFIRSVNARNPDTNAWAQLEASAIDVEAFSQRFEAEALELGGRLSGREVLGLLAGEIRPDMVKALDIIRSRWRVACITNNVPAGKGAGMSRTAQQHAAVAEVLARFEHVVESSKMGLRKPDPRIYTHTCELMGLRGEDCIYLDDLGINLKPARAMGMHTIKVETAAQAIGELESALGLSLR